MLLLYLLIILIFMLLSIYLYKFMSVSKVISFKFHTLSTKFKTELAKYCFPSSVKAHGLFCSLHKSIYKYQTCSTLFFISTIKSSNKEIIKHKSFIGKHMELIRLDCIFVAFLATLCLLLLLILTFSWWIFPILKHKNLKSCGLGGPTPRFPLGNIEEMKRKNNVAYSYLSHDIHSNVFPYFSSWQKLHGKFSYNILLILQDYFCIIVKTLVLYLY